MDDDGLLIEGYLDGDVDAFDRLVRRHSPPLNAFILYRLRDRARADDALQDVFVRVITGLHRYRHRGRFRAWLFRIAHNVLADVARRDSRVPLLSTESRPPGADDSVPTLGERIPAPENSQPDRIAERRELAAAAGEAVMLLPDFQREVFLMRQAGLTFREIARLQGCPINTALGRMHDAVRSLRRMMKI